jgi:hypothetical protein
MFRSFYENVGEILRKTYKDALTSNPGDGIVTRSDVADQIFRPLMEHCILVKREYAKKFSWVGNTFMANFYNNF